MSNSSRLVGCGQPTLARLEVRKRALRHPVVDGSAERAGTNARHLVLVLSSVKVPVASPKRPVPPVMV